MLSIKKPFFVLLVSLTFFGFYNGISIARGGNCPTATSITKLPPDSTFQNKGPFDPKTITKASATQTKKGLMVFLSNVAIDAKAAAPNWPLPPVTEKGNIAIVLTFINGEKPVVGIYEPKTFGKPLNLKTDIAFGFKGGGMLSSYSGTQGKAQITELSATKVCGNFDIQGSDGPVAGKFSAPIVK